MTTQEETARNLIHRSEGVLQTGAVPGGVAGAGRTEGTGLPIGKIAAEHGPAISTESFGQGHEQRRLRVRTGTVGQDEAVPVGAVRCVEESANGRVEGSVQELASGRARH